ncbi:hypothetical protein FBQ97_13895 [Acidobacteria bacterium ACD]|nr:MAG: hypothetical protein EDX89_22535 [Acidobacteriota bacterium]MDL1950888.1 hypothetical protein [Acidobacteria bacterium ACD]
MTRTKPAAAAPDANLDGLLEGIAKEHLGIETLGTRRSDALDFHDLAVWRVRAALEAAYQAGLAARKETRG